MQKRLHVHVEGERGVDRMGYIITATTLHKPPICCVVLTCYSLRSKITIGDLVQTL
jgi:hypothetical protein